MSEIQMLIDTRARKIAFDEMEKKISDINDTIKQEILRILDEESETISKLRSVIEEIKCVTTFQTLKICEFSSKALISKLRESCDVRIFPRPDKSWDPVSQDQWKTHWRDDICFAKTDIWDEGHILIL
ncbi:MAG TPA: hypothetical protein PKD85_00465 [Saprospiraceae bacterium]|nr:hypothetical protein [Saprospiraceae bacterium]